MIRIGLPPSPFPRIRPRWRTTRPEPSPSGIRARLADSVERHRRWLREDSPLARSRRARALREANLRRDLLLEFEARYEDLVDLLCWAAKEGVEVARIERYDSLRLWLATAYTTLKPSMERVAAAELADGRDPFLALLAPPDVAHAIHGLDTIEHIMRSRAVLEALRRSPVLLPEEAPEGA